MRLPDTCPLLVAQADAANAAYSRAMEHAHEPCYGCGGYYGCLSCQSGNQWRVKLATLARNLTCAVRGSQNTLGEAQDRWLLDWQNRERRKRQYSFVSNSTV